MVEDLVPGVLPRGKYGQRRRKSTSSMAWWGTMRMAARRQRRRTRTRTRGGRRGRKGAPRGGAVGRLRERASRHWATATATDELGMKEVAAVMAVAMAGAGMTVGMMIVGGMHRRRRGGVTGHRRLGPSLELPPRAVVRRPTAPVNLVSARGVSGRPVVMVRSKEGRHAAQGSEVPQKVRGAEGVVGAAGARRRGPQPRGAAAVSVPTKRKAARRKGTQLGRPSSRSMAGR